MVERTVRTEFGVGMSIALVKAVSAIEESGPLHLARLMLILLQAHRRAKKSVDGITKLAKIDFLLRYPTCLERTLAALGKDPEKADVQEFERTTIESKMVRFRYGPWDDRYRQWIGLLVAQGLVDTYVEGRTVHVVLTDAGRAVAEEFEASEEYGDLARRSKLIYRTVGSKSGTWLKDFVYRTFPEIVNMKWGDPIDL